MTAVPATLGVLAGLMGVTVTIPYIRDTLRGTTRPHRGAWLIWGTLAFVVCLSQRADGASWSLVLTASQAVVTSLVFVLAIRRGEGGASARDAIAIGLAAGGVTVWALADEPVVATAGVIGADLLAAVMVMPKLHRDPDSETLSTYAWASVCGALAAGAVWTFDVALLIYPVYYCLVNACFSTVIYRGRLAQR
jgi:hypothetical protein